MMKNKRYYRLRADVREALDRIVPVFINAWVYAIIFKIVFYG